MLSTAKTILVTGATSGIGLALVKQLHAQGHKVLAVARNATRLSQLERDCPHITTYVCDLSSRRQIETLADSIGRQHPVLDILINNAGIQYTPTVLDRDFSFDSIEHETTVNFLAPVWLSTLLLPVLLQNPAHTAIVNITSGLIFAPKTQSAIYSASKAALHSYSQSLRYQLAQTQTLVQEVILPLVDTAMTQGRGRNKLSPDEAARHIIRGIANRQAEIYVGKARLLPILMRLSPSLVKHIMQRY